MMRRRVPQSSANGVAEQDPDRCDVDDAAPGDVALVIADGYGSVFLELVDGALDDVALLVDPAIEGWWMPSPATLRSRFLTWPAGSGTIASMSRRRSSARMALLEWSCRPELGPEGSRSHLLLRHGALLRQPVP
jgi:hypothetical protein